MFLYGAVLIGSAVKPAMGAYPVPVKEHLNGGTGNAYIHLLLDIFIRYIYFTPNTVANTVKQQVSFTTCNVKGNEIVLTSSDNKLYKIRFIGDGFDSDEIKSISDGKTVVTTYSKEVTPDDEDDYYSIKAILNGDAYLLSFDETNRWHQEEYWPLLFFPIVFAIVWGAYIAGSIIVGRNPKKFSKKVIKLFFKDGYVKY